MKRNLITILALIIALSSCNDDALFEKEMYKNVVALISSDYYNTFEEVVTLSPTGEEATGYIAACTGGTHAPKKNMVIGLEEDLTSLEFYNRSLYDVDEACYAKFLPSDKYEIVDYKIQINAGERTGRTMIKIRPEGLSPDSTYFVGLKATDISGVEINESKNTILYQILIKNAYATQGENVFYSMTGLADGIQIQLVHAGGNALAGADIVHEQQYVLQVLIGGVLVPHGDQAVHGAVAGLLAAVHGGNGQEGIIHLLGVLNGGAVVGFQRRCSS